MLTIKLITEVILQVPEQTYAIKVWENGKWNILCTFPGTREGYEQASALMKYITGDACLEQLL